MLSAPGVIASTVLVAVLSCSRIAQPNIQGLDVLPADGTTAPRSTWIWAKADAGTVQLRDGELTVDVAESTVSVTGEGGPSTLVVLQPSAPLLEGKQYAVRVGANTVSTFIAGAQLDIEAPPAPAVAVGNIVGAHFGAYSCGNASVVTLSLTPAPELSFLVSTATTTLPATALSAGTGETLRTIALPEGEQVVRVLAVDLSGNVAASNTVTFTVPRKTSGCSAAPAAPLVLVALALLRRMRRRDTVEPG